MQRLDLADRLKAQQRFAEAAKSYNRALELDPALATASYQLACNYALWGKPDEARKAFNHALGIGFADYPMSYTDDELGSLRESSSFADQMRIIRSRYLPLQQSRLGQPVAFRPKGKRPEAGWPVVVLLHGLGDSHLTYLPEAKEWSKLGVLAIALPGSAPRLTDGFAWDAISVQPTHEDIEAALKSRLLRDQVDETRIILFGFSQGALHALGLLQTVPAQYAGVVALSPGGQPVKHLIPGRLDATRSRRIYFVHGKREPHAPIAEQFRNACTAAGWEFKLAVHLGAHELPENWDIERAQAKQFILASRP